jgi:hypothetical protein
LDVSKVDRVLHLSSPPFVASSLPKPAGHPYDAAAESFRIGGASRPSPLVTPAVQGPRATQNGRGAAQHGRACRGHGGGLVEGMCLRWQRGARDGDVEEIGRGWRRAHVCLALFCTRVLFF